MNCLRCITVFVELLLFSSFVYVLANWFVKQQDGLERIELKLIKIVGLLAMLAHICASVWYPFPNPIIFTIGIVLLILSGCLFITTYNTFKKNPPAVAFSTIITTELKTQGPYKFIRHPFYTSYSLAWLGGAFATGCWWLIFFFFVLGIIYYKAAKEEEQQWLQGNSASLYASFIKTTGMFFPKLF